ncbi:MAG: hypothetical protein MNSN_03950 [Minisyncoccus archaeiphilus]|jgi:hypothetical protein|nr:MAG: hypothetical protein BWY21_00819 [Parcubacteria group bacterium ADurb.Bin216]GMX59396.1 MAG: hypothetical protein MNSN_03950 [Candidatus Parcubacteria bacterium]
MNQENVLVLFLWQGNWTLSKFIKYKIIDKLYKL